MSAPRPPRDARSAGAPAGEDAAGDGAQRPADGAGTQPPTPGDDVRGTTATERAPERVTGTAPGPAFPLSPPAYRPWREGAVTRANELETLRRWLQGRPDSVASAELFQAVGEHLQIARDAAAGDRNRWRSLTGAALQRTASNLDASEATLLRLAPTSYLLGQLPSLQAHVRRHLPPEDPRRVQLEALARATRSAPRPAARGPVGRAVLREFTEEQRGILVAAVRAASSEAVRELMAANSFRNVLSATSVILTLLAGAVAVAGIVSPSTVPLCFAPEEDDRITVVCPTTQSTELAAGDVPGARDIDDVLRDTANRWDMLTVEAVGLTAAAISAAVALRHVRGTSTPVGIPIVLAVLKLPLGALVAVLGLLLMRGGIVPGLSALDSSAQILAWAVLFGYAQQAFTRLVDQQANAVLDGVRERTPPDAAAAPLRGRGGRAGPDGEVGR